jgi:putative ABC transport system permease protein
MQPSQIPPSQNSAAYWGEIWMIALQALRAHKVRAMLAMLGVVIGTGCIVLVVTVALTGQRYIIGQIEGVGANLIYANLVDPGEAGSVSLADQIGPADLAAVKDDMPQMVTQAAGATSLQMTVDADGAERDISLVGVTSGFREIRNLALLRGRYFDSDEMQSRSKVCLLTQQLAGRMFPFGDPIGRDVRVGEFHFTVIGVFRERVATFGQTEITRESVLVPFSLLQYYTGTEYFNTLYVRADNPEDVPTVTSRISHILATRHRSGAEYHVQNLTAILDMARSVALALTIVLILIALIALTISGIGIMNIMLVTVSERTREIGIRMAIGARRKAILYQFLMEALVISGGGALAGIAIGVLIPISLNLLINFIPDAGDITIPVSWVSVILAFIVSCSTGLIFGYIPASRASRLQPTQSLHYE